MFDSDLVELAASPRKGEQPNRAETEENDARRLRHRLDARRRGGGLAVQRWGEPRLTRDADLTLLTGFGKEARFASALLERKKR